MTMDWRQRCEVLEKELERVRADLAEAFACNRQLIEAHQREREAQANLIKLYQERERHQRLATDTERPLRPPIVH
jgi:hypothetical protein